MKDSPCLDEGTVAPSCGETPPNLPIRQVAFVFVDLSCRTLPSTGLYKPEIVSLFPRNAGVHPNDKVRPMIWTGANGRG